MGKTVLLAREQFLGIDTPSTYRYSPRPVYRATWRSSACLGAVTLIQVIGIRMLRLGTRPDESPVHVSSGYRRSLLASGSKSAPTGGIIVVQDDRSGNHSIGADAGDLYRKRAWISIDT